MMKSKLFILTRMLLKSGSNSTANKKPGFLGLRVNKNFLMGIVIFLAFLPLLINIVILMSYIYDTLVQIGQEGILMSLGILSVSFVVFFFGVFYCLSIFYFAYDIERLLVLPVKAWEIVSAKYITVLIYEYLTAAFIMLPVIGVFAYKSSPGIIYYLYAIILFLLVPVIPLVMSSILALVTMRFTSFGRNKDRFKMFGGIAALVLALGFNVAVQRIATMSMSPDEVQNLLIQGNNSMMGIFSKLFPGIGYAAKALSMSAKWEGFYSLIIFLILTILFFAVFMFLAGKLYFKGVIGISESGSSKALDKDSIMKKSERTSVIVSYALKEIRILLRTPIYFINCVLTNFLWPILLIVLPGVQAAGQGQLQLDMIKEFAMNPDNSFLIVAAAFCASIFIAGSNGITSTAISREGSQLYINKFIPVKFSLIIKSKVLSGIFFSFLGSLMMIIAFSVLLKLNALVIILSLLLSIPGIMIASFSGLIIDLYNPKLVWDNEQKAVKQNINVLANMFLSAALCAAGIFGAIKLELSIYTGTILLLLVSTVLCYALYKALLSIGPKLLAKME